MRDPLLAGLAGAEHGAVERVRTGYWVERLRRLGADESFRIADELLRHVRSVRPDWPSAADRARDLADHTRVMADLSHVRASRR